MVKPTLIWSIWNILMWKKKQKKWEKLGLCVRENWHHILRTMPCDVATLVL